MFTNNKKKSNQRNLPRVKSYADNSITTESPTTILTEFFLIFPDIVAKTIAFDGSISTRNMALGNDSVTFPVTWITSSLTGFLGPSRFGSSVFVLGGPLPPPPGRRGGAAYKAVYLFNDNDMGDKFRIDELELLVLNVFDMRL